MFNLDVIKIINEEISEFDFLSNDKNRKEFDIINILKNEDFQKQFICDSLLNPNKIKYDVYDSSIGGEWDYNASDANKISIEYFLNITYTYDANKEPIKFNLDFVGDSISINKEDYSGSSNDRDIPSDDGEWFSYVNWNDINIGLTTEHGDDIRFIAFERAPDKIKNIFVREYVSDFISNYTNIDVRTGEKDKITDYSYC